MKFIRKKELEDEFEREGEKYNRETRESHSTMQDDIYRKSSQYTHKPKKDFKKKFNNILSLIIIAIFLIGFFGTYISLLFEK